MKHAVIMAGGSGTRFWPASRKQLPKQLLPLHGDRTMIQSTVDRLGGLVDPGNVLVVTNEILVDETRRQLPQIEPDQIVGEPAKRDTAPCVGLAAAMILNKDPEGIMTVMPADHVIRDQEAYQGAVDQACAIVENHPERIVTFGIKPTYPAESFGYVERGDQRAESTGGGGENAPVFKVERFREKPKQELAQQFFDSGNFYWNSGIFVWKAKTIFDALAARQPEMHQHLVEIQKAIGTPDFQTVFQEQFSAIKGVSIDFAVMEDYPDVDVIEAPFDWDDVGNWQAVGRLVQPDSNGNSVIGQHVGVETFDSIVRGEDGHLIATLGMKDCIVVHTPNATLVADKSREESVREIVKQIEENGWTDFI